jgi:hypothetical protein
MSDDGNRNTTKPDGSQEDKSEEIAQSSSSDQSGPSQRSRPATREEDIFDIDDNVSLDGTEEVQAKHLEEHVRHAENPEDIRMPHKIGRAHV